MTENQNTEVYIKINEKRVMHTSFWWWMGTHSFAQKNQYMCTRERLIHIKSTPILSDFALSKVSIREQGWSDESPDVDRSADPGTDCLNPETGMISREQASTSVGGVPVCDRHHHKEGCKKHHEVEHWITISNKVPFVVPNSLATTLGCHCIISIWFNCICCVNTSLENKEKVRCT